MTNNQTECFINEDAYSVLIAIYSVVFLGGSCGTIMMTFLLCKTNTRSVTTTVVINLIVVHGIFLITVPFRIAYYIEKKWKLGFDFCRFISSMIHIHMYLSFVFYVTMLSIRFLIFFKQKDKIEFYRTLHSVVASTAVWVIIVIIVMPAFFVEYGKKGIYNTNKCFLFHMELDSTFVIVLNYVIIAITITVVFFFLVLQIIIVVKVVKKLHGSVFSHQEFWAQLKSLFFILVMVVCFFPYQLFRIYYLEHAVECCFYNEIFLAMTALSCLDLLLFALRTYFHKVCKSTSCAVKCPCKF
ncbi:putative G-protein coupled receptor 141 [Pelodytes ibericus]